MFIDSHTHLYDKQFDADRSNIIQKAIETGVTKMVLPNCDTSTIDDMLQLESEFKNSCFAMMGLHPCYVNITVDEELNVVKQWLNKRKFIAIGEIGLDYYWDKTFIQEQKKAFITQIELSLQYQLPIVIHNREATDDILKILKEFKQSNIKGVFHCFTGSIDTAKEIIDMGFLIGVGGVLTYKNSGLASVIKDIDLQHIVLETDAPYLSPVPYRGKRNESSYIKIIAEKLSEIKELPLTTIAEITTQNAQKLFNLN